MKTGHVVVLIVFFAIAWSTTRLVVFVPDGLLQVALPNEQMMLLMMEHPSTAIHPSAATTTTTTRVSPRMHRPFDNLTVIASPPSQPFPYSSFSCIQPFEEILQDSKSSNVYPDFVSRTCQFQNLYYNPQMRSFHYFCSPAEEKLMTRMEHNNATTGSIHDILKDKMTVAGSYIAKKHVKRILSSVNKPLRYGDWKDFQWHPKLHFFNSYHNSTLLRRWRDLSWSQQQQQQQQPIKHVVLLYHPSYSFNFGHFFLDDVATWFQMLQAFGHIHYDWGASDDDDTPIPIPVMLQIKGGDPLYRCTPDHTQWPSCVGIYQRLLPPLLHVQWEEDVDILRTGNLFYSLLLAKQQQVVKRRKQQQQPWEMIRLEHVIVGSGRLAHYACDGSCSMGRISWMPLFRRWMLHQLLLPGGGGGRASWSGLVISPTTQRPLDRKVDLAHDYITFSLPLNNSRATGLSNFSDIIQAAQARYGARRVQVVNLSNMTLSEQAWLVLHSCIFVTYEGGGSHTSIFLPPGATVVLYNSNSIYTHVKFQAYYRDKTWYDTMAQVRKVWVSAKDRNNVALAMNLFEHYIQ